MDIKDPWLQILTKIAKIEMDIEKTQNKIDEARFVNPNDLFYQKLLDDAQMHINYQRALMSRKKKEIYLQIGAV